MTFFKNIIISLVVIVLVLSVIILLTQNVCNEDKNTKDIKISIHQVKNGFGYSLSANSKIIIKQDFIPVIEKKYSFCTFNEALKVAKLVKGKLINNQSPTITMKDLKSLEIGFNCLDLP